MIYFCYLVGKIKWSCCDLFTVLNTEIPKEDLWFDYYMKYIFKLKNEQKYYKKHSKTRRQLLHGRLVSVAPQMLQVNLK
jgi:hypothetical protein